MITGVLKRPDLAAFASFQLLNYPRYLPAGFVEGFFNGEKRKKGKLGGETQPLLQSVGGRGKRSGISVGLINEKLLFAVCSGDLGWFL